MLVSFNHATFIWHFISDHFAWISLKYKNQIQLIYFYLFWFLIFLYSNISHHLFHSYFFLFLFCIIPFIVFSHHRISQLHMYLLPFSFFGISSQVIDLKEFFLKFISFFQFKQSKESDLNFKLFIATVIFVFFF